MNIKNNNIYYMYMPNRWIEFVKNWSKENKVSYGCALTKPEMKAEYHYRYPKVKTKGVAKLEESRPPEDVKSKVTYPNLKIRIPPPQEEEEQENIQFEMEEMGAEEQAKPKRGRPQKYMTAEEQYKAKLESNKQKRREKTAAKKNKPESLERPYNLVKQILMELDRKKGNYGDDRDPFGFIKDFIIIPERQGVSKADIIDKAYKYFQRATNINYDITHSVLMKPLFLELKDITKTG